MTTAAANVRSSASGRDTLSRAAFFGLAVSVALLPMRMVQLPLNIEPFDIWTALCFPLFWLYLLTGRNHIRMPYAVPVWLIFVASLIATALADDPLTSATVLVKEAYIYIWFVTTVALLSRFDPEQRQRIVSIWLWTTLAHGAVLIAQFVSPDFLTATTTGLDYTVYRPPGTFRNANGAALFQLMGYVPIALSRLNGTTSLAMGIVLLVSIVATGSMSAFAFFVLGLATVVALSALFLGVRKGAKTVAMFGLALLLGATAFNFTFLRNAQTEERLEYLFYGRAERSASGRFVLWGQARDLVVSGTPLWGIGPRNFQDAQLGGKSLHNDFLSFLLERGVVGAFGLVLLGLLALSKPVRVLIGRRFDPDDAIVLIMFVAIWLGIALQSQTHQIFHDRAVWFALAFQEIALAKALRSTRAYRFVNTPR